MKRLGVYAYISILVVSILGVFFSSSTQAVAQTMPVGGSYDYFQNMLIAQHTETIAALDAAATKFQNTTQAAAQQSITDKFKGVAEANNLAYTNTFNAEKAKGTPPVDAQIAALQAWTASSNLGTNLQITRAFTSSPQKSAYDAYARKVSGDLILTAGQIKRNPSLVGSAQVAVQTATGTITNAAAGNTNTAKQRADADPDECSLLTGNLLGCIGQLIAWIIKNTLLSIAGFLLWLTSSMFDYSVQVGILNFKTWAPDTLYPLWIIVRQIVSLLIVFVGLYLGFLYILGREDKFEKFIPWLVAFALFVNFSYPLARTAIDISNIVSLKIYTSIVGPGALSPGSTTAGDIILSRLGVTSLARSATAVEDSQSSVLGSINSVPGALMAVAFVGYAAYIFFMVTALIIMRTAALVFLTIASPLLLVDSVLPILGEKAKQIRQIFIEQLTVAPIFMLMLALTMKFLEVFSNPGGPIKSAGVGTLASGTSSTVATFFNLAMMLIMLHITITVTKKAAGAAGQYATDAMGKVGGFAVGAAAGGAGLLARGTLGAAAGKLRDSSWVQRNQDTFIGRRAYDMSNSLAKSSYDLTNSSVIKSQMSKIGMGGGMGMGRATLSKLGAGDAMSHQEAYDKKMEDRTTRFSRIGVRTKNKYDSDGKIVYRKGEKDNSKEMVDARQGYINSAGGAVFASSNTKSDVRNKLETISNSSESAKLDKAMLDYRRFDDDSVGRDARQNYIDKLKLDDPKTAELLEKKAAEAQMKKDKEKADKDEVKNNNKELIAAIKDLKQSSTPAPLPTTPQPVVNTAKGETVSSGGIIVPPTSNTRPVTVTPPTVATPQLESPALQKSSEEVFKEISANRAARQAAAIDVVKQSFAQSMKNRAAKPA